MLDRINFRNFWLKAPAATVHCRRAVARRLLVACLLLPGTALAKPDAPAMMVLTGSIAPGNGPLAPRPGAEDLVIAFNGVDGSFVGEGRVGSNGEFAIIIGRTASFNGTSVLLELQHGRGRYQLLRDGQPAWLKFAGRALPERTVMALAVGQQTAELPDLELKNPQAQRLSRQGEVPCDALADANADGRCDAEDWAILQLYGGGVTRTVGRP